MRPPSACGERSSPVSWVAHRGLSACRCSSSVISFLRRQAAFDAFGQSGCCAASKVTIGNVHAIRKVVSSDNSIYRGSPQAVLFPRHDIEAVRIAKLAKEPALQRLEADAARRRHGHERANRSNSRPSTRSVGLASCRRAACQTDARYRLSCRCQAQLIDGVRFMHLVQALLQAVKSLIAPD